jgi:hypothetical protein
MMDPSFAGPSTKLLFAIWSIVVLLLGSVTHLYLTRHVKLPFPVAAIDTKANNKEVIDEAKSKVSRPTFEYSL